MAHRHAIFLTLLLLSINTSPALHCPLMSRNYSGICSLEDARFIIIDNHKLTDYILGPVTALSGIILGGAYIVQCRNDDKFLYYFASLFVFFFYGNIILIHKCALADYILGPVTALSGITWEERILFSVEMITSFYIIVAFLAVLYERYGHGKRTYLSPGDFILFTSFIDLWQCKKIKTMVANIFDYKSIGKSFQEISGFFTFYILYIICCHINCCSLLYSI